MYSSRSTSRASKERRDLINKEIDELRELLPLTKSTKGHLSYIQVMSAACAYIRKGNYFNKVSYEDPVYGQTSFGFHQVELISKGAFLKDLVDEEDLHFVWNQLQIPANYDGFYKSNERRFVCRMLKSQCFKRRLLDCVAEHSENRSTPIYVKGKVYHLSPEDSQTTVLLALCYPLLEPSIPKNIDKQDTIWFTTIHDLNLRIKAASESIKFFIGFTQSQLLHRSWYQFVHHNDLQEAVSLHCRVRSGGGQCTAVLRMLTRDGCVINVKTNADLIHQDDVDPYSPVIHFSNRVLSNEEADYYRVYGNVQ
ncbi:neuronal PAS domain-containing protein 4-like isoform X2 [Apostichopus japonicus]|uniref:neuronal PAS domain-containing protein 4-like isoform X2 n=1 Tax=Stichopus japonicus TaxID=307972 RepID=UPI003AB2700D